MEKESVRAIHILTLIKREMAAWIAEKSLANACSDRLSAEKKAKHWCIESDAIRYMKQMADYIKLCDFWMESQRNCCHFTLDHVPVYRNRIILCLVSDSFFFCCCCIASLLLDITLHHDFLPFFPPLFFCVMADRSWFFFLFALHTSCAMGLFNKSFYGFCLLQP